MGWDALSADYRRRLENKGITAEQYNSGVPLKVARGHGKTPESPRRHYDPEKYRDYKERREDLERRLAEKKTELFGDRPRDVRHGPRWNEERSAENIRKYAPSMKLLRWAIEASEDELIDAIRDDPDTYAFLGYH